MANQDHHFTGIPAMSFYMRIYKAKYIYYFNFCIVLIMTGLLQV